MYVIDGSSHFTQRVREYKVRASVTDERMPFVENGRLCFGHWEVGQRHNTFVVLLRLFEPADKKKLADDIAEHCSEAFGKQPPDVVVYPGDSTAIHLVHQLADTLRCPSAFVVASEAFRSGDHYETRLEFGKQVSAVYREKAVLNVLFFDDSFSSGQTERHVLESFSDAIEKDALTEKINWLTYTVLRRAPAPRHRSWKIKKRKGEADVAYRAACSFIIGSQSLSFASCPLCRAAARVDDAIHWSRGSRKSVQRLLQDVQELLMRRPIEHLQRPVFTVRASVAMELLLFEDGRMPDVCYHIATEIVTQSEGEAFTDRIAAAILYCTLHFDDILSYITNKDIFSLLKRYALAMPLDNKDDIALFIIANALLPCSNLTEYLRELSGILSPRGAVDVTACLMALTFAGQHQAFNPSGRSDNVSLRRTQLYLNRREDLEGSLQAHFRSEGSKVEGERPGVAEMTCSDLALLARSPREDDPAWLIRTICALLHSGDHASFLSKKLENVNEKTSQHLRDSLVQVIDLMQHLPPNIVGHLGKSLSELRLNVLECRDQDVDEIKCLAARVIVELWENKIKDDLIFRPAQMHALMRDCTVVPSVTFKQSYPHLRIRPDAIIVVPNDREVTLCEVMAPGVMNLKSHFSNLLVNPFEHYPIQNVTIDDLRTPVVVVYFIRILRHQMVKLCVVDRFKPPETSRLWSFLAGGLANVRALMQLVGGDVEHVYLPNGFVNSEVSPGNEQIKYLEHCHINASNYKNMFISSFPLTKQILA